MGTELAAIRDELHSTARVQIFKDMLSPYRLPVEAWRAGFVSFFENNSYLLGQCSLQSVVSSAVTIAVLGLRMDRATGQSCVVPFGGAAQPIVMVQGYTVIAGRSGFIMQSTLVRERDEFSERRGSEPGIDHRPARDGGKVVGTYAVARSKNHPTLFTPFMSLDEILAVRDRSKGYTSAKSRGKSHPWMTDFDAMMLKTPKRRLQKDIPNDQLAQAAWLDTMHDMGRVGYLNPNGPPTEIAPPDGDGTFPDRQPGITDVEDLTQSTRPMPKIDWSVGEGREPAAFKDIAIWQQWMLNNIERVADVEKLRANLERNRPTLGLFSEFWPDAVKVVMKAFKDRGVE